MKLLHKGHICTTGGTWLDGDILLDEVFNTWEYSEYRNFMVVGTGYQVSYNIKNLKQYYEDKDNMCKLLKLVNQGSE